MPLKRARKLTIAIPASLVSDVPHLREKTFRIGLIGRAAAIFRIDEVIVFPDFPDKDQRRDAELIATILSYMETPQYLRKGIFEIRPELRYAGVLPPLRTPHHPLADRTENLMLGEYREGVTTAQVKEGTLVDIGVEKPLLIEGKKISLNNRVTVKVTELEERLTGVLANRREIKQYWGYIVTVSEVPFGQLMKTRRFDLVVATSRFGKPLITVIDELKRKCEHSRTILLAFGAPTQGLYEIAAHERLKLEELAHFIVNTIPEQGTETVRTEEAFYCALAIVNMLIEK